MSESTDAQVTDTAAWVVNPTGPLTGDVTVRGSKNAVTKHLVASMLGGSPSTIANVPDIGDVEITCSMLSSLGCVIERTDNEITIDPSSLSSSRVPLRFTGMNRIPILDFTGRGQHIHKLGNDGVLVISLELQFHASILQTVSVFHSVLKC